MDTHNPNTTRDSAIALYETAIATHKRQDWRLASHGLYRALMATAASVEVTGVPICYPPPRRSKLPRHPRESP